MSNAATPRASSASTAAMKPNGHYPRADTYGSPDPRFSFPPAPGPFLKSIHLLITIIVMLVTLIGGGAIFYAQAQDTHEQVKQQGFQIQSLAVFVGKQDAINSSLLDALSDIRTDVRSLRRE